MISVVIPAYNEASRLPRTLAEIESFHKKHPNIISEVIVVDDGSKDATVEVCMYYAFRMPLRIERLAKNSGKWSAVIQGFNFAKQEAILILDADGSAQIWELEKLNIKEVLDKKISVFGSRFDTRSSVEGKGFLRAIVSVGYRVFAHTLYYLVEGRKCPVQDTQAPFKLIHKSRLQGDFFAASRFAGDLNFVLLCSGPMSNLPLDFIHVRGGVVKPMTVMDMFFESIKVARKLRRYLVSLDRRVPLYISRNHNIYKHGVFR